MSEKMFFILYLSLILLDQYTKYLAVKKLKYNQYIDVFKFLRFTLLKNYGIAYNLLSGKTKLIIRINLLLIACLGSYLISIFDFQNYTCLKIALIFIIGGGTSNLIDRITNGYVRDFISFKIKKFPIFNIADLFVIIGSVMFIIANS